jgi:hypothetical protein
MNNPMVITIEKTMLAKHCLLLCTNCGTTTNHVLSRSGEFYSCGCGEIVWIEFPNEEIEDELLT